MERVFYGAEERADLLLEWQTKGLILGFGLARTTTPQQQRQDNSRFPSE